MPRTWSLWGFTIYCPQLKQPASFISHTSLIHISSTLKQNYKLGRQKCKKWTRYSLFFRTGAQLSSGMHSSNLVDGLRCTAAGRSRNRHVFWCCPHYKFIFLQLSANTFYTVHEKWPMKTAKYPAVFSVYYFISSQPISNRLKSYLFSLLNYSFRSWICFYFLSFNTVGHPQIFNFVFHFISVI